MGGRETNILEQVRDRLISGSRRWFEQHKPVQAESFRFLHFKSSQKMVQGRLKGHLRLTRRSVHQGTLGSLDSQSLELVRLLHWQDDSLH